MINPTRRGFLGLMTSALAAPVIVKASSIMPVKTTAWAHGGYIGNGTEIGPFISHDFVIIKSRESGSFVTYNRILPLNEYRKIVEPALNDAFKNAFKDMKFEI